MKKNISINISGIIFHIEEDGYDNLRKYLDSITKYFSSFEDSSEIMADIESRIAEIFLSKLSEGKQVITAEDVQSLITTMGSVSDFKAAEEQEFTQGTESAKQTSYSSSSNQETSSSQNTSSSSSYTTPRQLMRDQQRKVLGGVCAGLAHYFNVDAVWIRLLFAILAFAYGFTILVYVIMWIAVPGSYTLEEPKAKKMFRDPERKVIGGVSGGVASYLGVDIVVARVLFIVFSFAGGIGFIVYIVLWITLPEARSLTDRMQMQGEPVTLSNIESNIKKNLNVDQDQQESTATKILLFPFRLIGMILRALGKIIVPLVEAIRVIIGILISMFGICIVLVALISGALLLGIISSGILSSGELRDAFPIEVFTTTAPGWMIFAGFIGTIVPGIFIVLLGISVIAKRIVFSPAVGWTLFVLFFVSSVLLIAGVPKIIYTFAEDGVHKVETTYSPTGKRAVLRLNEVGKDGYHGADLTIKGYDGKEIKLVEEFTAQGSTRQKAIENAQMVSYHVDVQDSIFTFDSNITFNEGWVFRNQRMIATLYIPYDYPFTMTGDVSRFITQGVDYNYRDGHTWRMTPKGLDCLSCPVAEGDPETQEISSESYEGSDFDEIEINGLIDARIEQGTEYRVELTGPQSEKEKYKITRENGRLVIDYQDDRKFWQQDLVDIDEIKIQITLPKLERLEGKGAGKINFKDFDVEKLDIELLGAIKLRGELKAEDVTIDLSGASEVEIEGKAKTLEAVIQGASTLRAYDFEVRDAVVEVNGASSAKVNVSGTLEMDEGFASSIDYRGHPDVVKRDH